MPYASAWLGFCRSLPGCLHKLTVAAMPLTEALAALTTAYRAQCRWLLARAEEFESGKIKVFRGDQDVTEQTAVDYRHCAGNLEAIIVAYARLEARTDKPAIA